MNDSLSQTGNTPRIIQQNAAKAETTVKIITLPEALQNNARGQRLEGEVVRQNADGSTRVRTPQGDVDIEVRGRQPQPGQRVEIDLPAGRPPRQAVVRNALDAPPPQTQTRGTDQQPVQTQLTRTQVRADVIVQNARSDQARALIDNTARPQPQATQPAPARPTSAPPQAQTYTAPPLQTNTGAAPLPPGTPVRLTPISTAQVQQFLNQFAQTIQVTPTSIQTAAFQAMQSVQTVLSQNLQTLLNVTAPPKQLLAQSPVQPQLQLQAQAHAQTPLQNLLQSVSTPPVQILPAGTQTPANLAIQLQTLLPPQQSVPLTALPQSPIHTQIPAQSFTAPMPFDVKVQNVLQTPAQIDLDGISQILQPVQQNQTVRTPSLPAQITLPQSITNAAAQAGQIVGQVTGFTPQNLPIISFQFAGQALPQSFVLQYQATNLTLGSQIIIQPNSIPTPSTAPQTAGAPQSTLGQIPQALLAFGDQFPPLLMEETYQALLQASPALAASMTRPLPSPANPSQLGAAALLFLAAVRAGDLNAWLGERKIDMLQRLNQTNLISRLSGTGGRAAPQASVDIATPSGDWRAVPLPMFWNGEMQRVNLFVRKDNQNASPEDKGKTQTRFIFDLSMSRMGEVQLDGLMREDRLDMVMRTQNPLSAPMQQMLKQLYTKALDSESLRGELGFQGDPRQWVNILKEEQHFGADA